MPRSKWNRKRKAEVRLAKSGQDHRGKDASAKPNQDYSVAKTSNPRMEAYYSLVGLHDLRYVADGEQVGTFEPCATDAEKTAERERFMSALRSILPASFRIDRSLDSVVQLKLIEEMKEFVGKEMEVEIELPKRSEAAGGTKDLVEKDDGRDGEVAGTIKRKIAPAKPIPFLSTTVNGSSLTLGYQLSVDRRTLRRNPSLAPLHEWLKIHTDCGHLTRQETVSMIPPVVLDVKEGMAVLDMCAAPGSKTCQLVEVVGGFDSVDVNDSTDGSGAKYQEPKGYVVANDADPKRAYMLVTQLRRLQSPSVFVTSCDGQYFPILDEKEDKGTEREGMFDRVLCDVPCSGDGTVRKNPGIWRHWNQNGALALHPLQLSIALRGARVTRVGGYMVYSTCSMNPMENESVVAELLRIANGSLLLDDPRPRMEGLIARPGWSAWRVLQERRGGAKAKNYKKKNSAKMIAKRKEWEEKRERGEADGEAPNVHEDGTVGEDEETKFERSPYHTLPYIPPDTWDEAALRERTTSLGFVEYATYADVEPEWRRRIRASCFPPTEAEAKEFHLHKCLRCLPHDMDTGGFFVALLRKVKPLGKDATERMNQLSRESKGGVEVDLHLSSKSDGNVGISSDAAVGEENDATMIASSAVDQTDDEPPKKSNKPESAEMNEEVEEEAVQKAPTGKVGHQHNRKKKENGDLGNEDFIPLDESIWPAIIDQFGLGPDFPKEQYMARASGEAKVLYFISKSIKEELIDRGIQSRVTIINSGLKAFERCSIQDTKAKYRISQEGIQFVVPHMTKRLLVVNGDDFYKCIAPGFIEFNIFSQTFQDEINKLEPGSFVIALEGHDHDVGKKMFLVMWRRQTVLECFVAKVEMDGIKSRLRALGFAPPEDTAPSKEDSPVEEAEDDGAA